MVSKLAVISNRVAKSIQMGNYRNIFCLSIAFCQLTVHEYHAALIVYLFVKLL